MKKFLALILAFALTLSLAAPALAAEPTVNGSPKATVKGTYDPDITLTGVSLSANAECPDALTVDEENKQYIITIPAGETSAVVDINVEGQNLDLLTQDNQSYAVLAFSSYTVLDGKTSLPLSVYADEAGTIYSLKYTETGTGGEWIDTGWTAVVKQAYSITRNESNSAQYTLFNVDKTGALPGETVTVTAAAADGYRLTGVTGYYESGSGFSLTQKEEGVYTFLMPEANVSLKLDTQKLYSVNFGNIQNGFVRSSVNEAVENERVFLAVSPASVMQLSTLEVSYVNASGETKYVSVNTDHSFRMPGADVTVYATFEDATKIHEINVETATGGTVRLANDVFRVTKDTDIILEVTPDTGYLVKSVTVSYTDGEDNPQTLTPSLRPDGSYTFPMPDADASVSAEFYKPAVITGMALTVNGGQEQTSGKVVVKTTDTVVLKVMGENLCNAGSGYWIGEGISTRKLSEYTVDPSGTFATSTLLSSNYPVNYEYALSYTNPDSDWVYPGLSILFVEPGAEITGVTVEASEGCWDVEVDSENKQYIVTEIKGAFRRVAFRITGNDLNRITDSSLLAIKAGTREMKLAGLNVGEENASGVTFGGGFDAGPLCYTNDGVSWIDTGWTIVVRQRYAVTVDSEIENGTVTSDLDYALPGDTVTLTCEGTGAYELESLTVTYVDDQNEAVEVDVTDGPSLYTKQFVMPEADVSVTATFREIKTVSAEISWGSMSFNYTDGQNGAQDGTWSNDGSAKAGTVTVTNTGETAISVTAAYTSVTDDYGPITGYLDEAKVLDTTESGTFTLTLSGIPTKAIPTGTKIGSVTVTIEEYIPAG